MILLVTGLVAVIVVVLIAVFLSIRLGRADEDDEPELRPDGRARRRDQDERWRDPDTRRVPSPNRPAGRAGSARGRAGEGDGYGSRAPARERDHQGHDGAPRRPARADAPGYRNQPRQAVAASVASRGRYDTAPPSRRLAGDIRAPGHPSGEFPAAGYGATDEPTDRREPRRKAAPAPAAGKSRSRQRGKRGDDDDWPSTEWDQLSDEQYWAELSADKPLSSMARPAKPASAPVPTAPANGSTKSAPPAREPRRAPARDLPSRMEREPATERLPVRSATRARRAQVPSAPPPARREADLAAASRSRPEPRPLPGPGPRSSRDTAPRGIRETGPRPLRDTGPQPGAGHRRQDSTGPHAASGEDLAVLAGFTSAPPPIPGALDDDPLTSPSFSLKAGADTDTRSYSNARRHAKTTGPAPVPGAGPANGNGSGSYPAADYTDPGYAYQAAPPAAVPPPAPAADWHSAPAAPAAEARAPAYGNPYQHPGRANGSGGLSGEISVSGAAGGYPNYLADPLRVYSPPGYEAKGTYAEATGTDAYQAVPAPRLAGTAPYADGYAGHPYADRGGHPDGYRSGAPVPGYEQQGYRADPYAAGGYSPYPSQG
jgi:hypothetical protein